MGLGRSDSLHVLTCPSLCGPQEVSGPWLVGLFPCPDLSLLVRSPDGEWASVGRILPCPDLSLPVWSPVGEWASVGRILSVS